MSFKSLSESLSTLFPTAAPAASEKSESPLHPPVRNKRGERFWQASMAQAYCYVRERTRGADAKEEVFKRFEEAMAEGPDFIRIRRKAQNFGATPCPAYTAEAAREIMAQAKRIEAESYKVRAEGKHGGSLGRMAMRLLEWFLFEMWPKAKHGMHPSLAYIATHARMSKDTVVQAMKRLELHGFLTVTQRRKFVQTEFGRKVVQDTNNYVLNLAQGLGALALSIFGKPSESGRPSAKDSSSNDSTIRSVKRRSEPPNLGFWTSIKEAWESS